MSKFAGLGAIRMTRLMKKYGDNDSGSASIVLRRLTGATIDRVNKERTGGTEVDTDLIGIVKDRKNQTVDASRVVTGQFIVHVDSETEPLESDLILINGNQFTITAINKINMGDVVVAYTIGIQK